MREARPETRGASTDALRDFGHRELATSQRRRRRREGRHARREHIGNVLPFEPGATARRARYRARDRRNAAAPRRDFFVGRRELGFDFIER